MYKKMMKEHIIQSLEKKAKKILVNKYSKKEILLKEKFIEINNMLNGNNIISDKDFFDLIERGIEPVMHIYGHCFLVSYFENHTFGIANFKTKKLILPCKYSDITFDNTQKNTDGILVYAENIFGETHAYLVKDTAQLIDNSLNEKSAIIKNIARKHNFSTGVDITKADEIIV